MAIVLTPVLVSPSFFFHSVRMSSEEKILDPSDKGPPPPPGGSVGTPTGSPASTDKRPRGRPRKDAPSAAAQPSPAPRQRKK